MEGFTSSSSDDRQPATGRRSESWLIRRVMCPCKRCKYQIRRQRRIAIAHVRRFGRIQRDEVMLDARPDIRMQSTAFRRAIRSMNNSINVEVAGVPQHEETVNADEADEEDATSNDGMDDMIDAFLTCPHEPVTAMSDAERTMREMATTPLYDGSSMSKLRSCLSILNLQARYGWSDVSVTALMRLLQKMLPEPNTMPASRGEAKDMLTAIGMDYNVIHACQNDCVLFRGENESLVACPRCGACRFRQDLQGNNIPVKVLRHFPIIDRIRHMYRCKSIAELMTWHVKNRSSDEVLRIPPDCVAWKHIDETWPDFAQEPRNLRLGLATDGVNPFGLRSSNWSTWPVVLVNYNIPPWLSIKKGHLLLALLIPGKYKAKNMDIYLAPLVEELQILWNGISVFDISRGPRRGNNVHIRAILMWTMHDFPGYGECSGLQTSGYHACPLCGDRLEARYSRNLRKMIYEGHERYLPADHVCREGLIGPKPPIMKAGDWLRSWRENGEQLPDGMRRLSIFHTLPYWGQLRINHLLDPMHIFKNVACSIWDHLTGEKDTRSSREDLREMDRMENLWPIQSDDLRIILPKAPWILTKAEETIVKNEISSFRTPTGHMRCLKGAFTKDKSLTGLKSHDWHKFMQFILPISIKGCLTDDIRQVIYKLSAVIRWMSLKEIPTSTIEKARVDSVEAVCLLQKHFPTSIMTSQAHLVVHVVDEVAVAGTVHSRWMFFLERFMKTLKGFVRQKARPEGCMAEGWLLQESIIYITEYLRGMDVGVPTLVPNNEDERITSETSQGKGIRRRMDESLRDKVNMFCLMNMSDIQKWCQRYDEVRHERVRARGVWRTTRRNQPYPENMTLLPKHMTCNWLEVALRDAAANGENITDREWEFARGCDFHVSILMLLHSLMFHR